MSDKETNIEVGLFSPQYYPITQLPEDSILRKVGTDFTYELKDKEIGDFSEREKELLTVMKILGRRTKGNPLIIGEAGVGKTFLVKCLAYKIVKKDVPHWLLGRKIIKTSYNDIMALSKDKDNYWASYLGNLKEVISESIKNPIILFMDEIHYIFDFPQSMNILKPYLTDGRLKMIGATTIKEYMRYIERDEAIARRYQLVTLPEPSDKQLRTILASEKSNLEKLYDLNIPEPLIDVVIKLSSEYLPYRFQPDKSIDILEQVAINCNVDNKKTVEIKDIRKVITEITGIPDENLKGEQEKMSGLETLLNHRILGQTEVIGRIAERLIVTENKVQINPERPLGVFLLAGPSGVGKTELAIALAEYFTGSKENLVRIDMSIYKTVFSLNSLLGIPGSVVVTKGGDAATEYPYLTLQMRKIPFSVLLLDEIDKADPEVLTIFLQAFDSGILTDYQGNKIYFNNVIVVMTCNVGFEQKIGSVGFGTSDKETEWEKIKKEVMNVIEATFRKEFLGRIDEILIFKPLNENVMEGFINQKLKKLESQIGKKISLSQEVIELIKKTGFDEKYGARPLNRAIDNVIGKALAELKMVGGWENISSVKIALKDNRPESIIDQND